MNEAGIKTCWTVIAVLGALFGAVVAVAALGGTIGAGAIAGVLYGIWLSTLGVIMVIRCHRHAKKSK